MAHAVCETCGIVLDWHAGRGFRLAEERCGVCRGQLRAATERETLTLPHFRLVVGDTVKLWDPNRASEFSVPKWPIGRRFERATAGVGL